MVIELFPKIRRPYFIVAPAYTSRSSGVRVLHLLCHVLRGMGEKAWICPQGSAGGFCLNPLLSGSVLTGDVVGFYKDAEVSPIVVYPDTVLGHPLGFGTVVRYLLAPAGAYGGSSAADFGRDDIVYKYRTDLPGDYPVLCLPTFDPNVFYPPRGRAVRSGACYYAHKYDRIHGNTLLPITSGARRLEGSFKEIAEMLRGCEVCYIYEQTEMIVLAEMCGCPVSFVKTPYYGGVDLGTWDFAIYCGERGDDACGRWYDRFVGQLRGFVEETQK